MLKGPWINPFLSKSKKVDLECSNNLRTVEVIDKIYFEPKIYKLIGITCHSSDTDRDTIATSSRLECNLIYVKDMKQEDLEWCKKSMFIVPNQQYDNADIHNMMSKSGANDEFRSYLFFKIYRQLTEKQSKELINTYGIRCTVEILNSLISTNSINIMKSFFNLGNGYYINFIGEAQIEKCIKESKDDFFEYLIKKVGNTRSDEHLIQNAVLKYGSFKHVEKLIQHRGLRHSPENIAYAFKSFDLKIIQLVVQRILSGYSDETKSFLLVYAIKYNNTQFIDYLKGVGVSINKTVIKLLLLSDQQELLNKIKTHINISTSVIINAQEEYEQDLKTNKPINYIKL